MKMRLETYYRVLKHDSKGELIKDTGLIPSRSYVIQFLELIESILDETAKTATDVDNAESAITQAATRADNFGRVDAAVGDDTHGIVVGTNAGTTDEDNENHALDTKITDGGGVGQLNYQAVTFLAPVVDAPNVDFDITRTFTNTSEGGVTVKEIGIICKNSAATKYHLLLRDVVADEAVADGFTLTVVYTLHTTV